MRPEAPFFIAGAIAIGGGIYREKGWPSEGTNALLATFVLVIVASMSADTPLAPLVRAFGFLACIGSVMATTRYVQAAKAAEKRK
jgi:hypothetical protein